MPPVLWEHWSSLPLLAQLTYQICSLTYQLTKYLTLDTGAATRVDDTGSLGAHIASPSPKGSGQLLRPRLYSLLTSDGPLPVTFSF